jgi:hypothetical protein
MAVSYMYTAINMGWELFGNKMTAKKTSKTVMFFPDSSLWEKKEV